MAQSVAKLMEILKEDIESAMGVPDFGQSEAFRAHAMNSAMYAMQQRQYELEKAKQEEAYLNHQLQQAWSSASSSLGAASYTASNSGGALTQTALNRLVESVYGQNERQTVHSNRGGHSLVRWLRASLDPDFSLRDENLHDDGPVL